MIRRLARVGALGAGILLIGVLAGAGLVTADRAIAAEGDPEGNLSVVITDDETDPTPTPTPSPVPTMPPGANPPGPPKPGDVEQEVIINPDDADDALGDDPSDFAGKLAMSGLTASVSPSFAPDNGTVTLIFTVRNTSATPFDSTARFWITNAVGARIADQRGVEVKGLAAGETRRVKATFGALGQHTMLTGYVKLTPPKSVEGQKLSPLTRNTLIVLPPLLGLSVLGGLAGVGGLLWWVLGPRGLGLIRFFGVARVAA